MLHCVIKKKKSSPLILYIHRPTDHADRSLIDRKHAFVSVKMMAIVSNLDSVLFNV